MDMKSSRRSRIAILILSVVSIVLAIGLAVSHSRLHTAGAIIDELVMGNGIGILIDKSEYYLGRMERKEYEGINYDPTAELLDLAEDSVVMSRNLQALDPYFEELSGYSEVMDNYCLETRERRAIYSAFFRQYHDFLMEDVQRIEEKVAAGEKITVGDLSSVSAFCTLFEPKQQLYSFTEFVDETITENYQRDWRI